MVKRIIVTSETLPGILRFSQVFQNTSVQKFQVVSQSEPYYLNPLELAVEQMKEANEDLQRIAQEVKQSPIQSTKPLTGKILGIIQADVSGGINNYDVDIPSVYPFPRSSSKVKAILTTTRPIRCWS